ncbi:MAG: hypothetical protein Q7T59_01985 [Candidatus Woesebacteria bacterium]|nr:hypothetical protein [Candidatus Woesebacteria bacterium]
MESESIKFPTIDEEENNETIAVSNKHAVLHYCYEKDGEYTIEYIWSSRHGEAKKIVKEFVNHIGQNKKVEVVAIIEPDSRQRLSELGVLGYVEKNKQSIIITTPGVFKSLKITRLLIGGGLNIDNINVSPIPGRIMVDSDIINPRAAIKVMCHS